MAESTPIDMSVDPYVKGKLWQAGGKGRTPPEAIKMYKTWATSYEQDLLSVNYTGHANIGDCLQDLYQSAERETVRILDVGSGTGLVGLELKRLGFAHVDALDPSAEMLEVSRAQHRYENYIEAFLNEKQLNISENTYDTLTAAGVFSEGAHVPVEGLYEMIRLVKPGGYIILTTRVSLVEKTEIYKDLEPVMRQLETEGRWKKLKRDTSTMLYSDRQGILFLFKVL